jgi:hypothetical protein
MRFGDPLGRGVEISALPILANNGRVLSEFSKVIQAPSRFEAFKAWVSVYVATMPYIHQRLATLTVKPEGSPDGEPVLMPWSYAEDEALDHLELTHNPPPPREGGVRGAFARCCESLFRRRSGFPSAVLHRTRTRRFTQDLGSTISDAL